MNASIPSPIILPELGTTSELHVGSWLVDLGDRVEIGDRVAEVLMRGIVFHVAASASGIVTGIAKPEKAIVRPGDTLGWIEAKSELCDDNRPTEDDE